MNADCNLKIMEMKKMPIRQFGKAYSRNIHEAPIVITKAGENAFVILPYSDYETMRQGTLAVKSEAGSAELPGRQPVQPEVNPVASFVSAGQTTEKRREGQEDIKPTLFDQIKSLLNKKLF